MNRLAALIALCCLAAGPVVTLTLPDGSTYQGELSPTSRPAPATVPAPVTPPPATVPSVPVVVPPVVVPPVDPNVIPVAVGQSWVAAVKRAHSGQIVRLAAGEFREALTDTNIRPHGVKIHGAGRDADGRWLTTIRVASGTALIAWVWDNASISGIRFVSDAPTSTGVALWGCHNVLLDNCEVSGFTFGVTLEIAKTRRGIGNIVQNCVIHGNWNPKRREGSQQNQDSSGLFAGDQDGLTLRNNVFDANGWMDGAAIGSDRNHNAYLAGNNGPAVVTGNIFAHASSHGLQCRCGGTVTGNLFLDNGIGMSFGLVNGGGPLVPGGVTGIVQGNVFCGSRALAGKMLGYGIEVSNAKDVTIEGNTFASDVAGTAPGVAVAAIKLDVCDLVDNHPQKGKQVVILKASIVGNSVTWPGAPLWLNGRVDRSKVTAQSQWAVSDVATVRAAAVARLALATRGAAQ